MLALMAGCTNEDVNRGEDINATKLTFTGSLESPVSRATIGDYTEGDESVSLLWQPGDEVVIVAANEEGTNALMVNTYTPYSGIYTANTTTEASTTGFTYSDGKEVNIPDGTTKSIIYAMYPSSSSYYNFTDLTKASASNVNLIPTASQSYDPVTGEPVNKMVLFGKGEWNEGDESVSLSFRNVYATLMIGVSGSAKISSIDVAANGANLAYTTQVANRHLINFTLIPEAGITGTSYPTGFIGGYSASYPLGDAATISVPFSTRLSLTDEVRWIPVMVRPFNASEITITVHATSDTGEEKTVVKTIKPDQATEVTTNSIAYITLNPITATEVDQAEPKSDWAAGEVVKDDDFSWVVASLDTSTTPQYGYGWISSYNNSYGTGENTVAINSEDIEAQGYILPSTVSYPNVTGYPVDNGALFLGGSTYSATQFSYMLDALSSWTGSVTVSFRAAIGSSTSYGATNAVYVSAGDKVVNATDLTPYTWYDFTMIIEDASASTTLTFSSGADNFYISDLSVKISETSDTENLTGTAVAKGTAALVYNSLNEASNTITISALSNTLDPSNWSDNYSTRPYFEFVVTGPWTLTVDETATDWLDVVGPSWDFNNTALYEDANGNETLTRYALVSKQSNETGATRTATLTLSYGGGTSTTFTVNQPAAGPLTEVFAANFGTPSEQTTVTNTMDATTWGITKGEVSMLTMTYGTDGNNSNLALSNAQGNPDGSLFFVGSMPATDYSGGGGVSPWTQAEADNDAEAFLEVSIPVENAISIDFSYDLNIVTENPWGIGYFYYELSFDDTANTTSGEVQVTNDYDFNTDTWYDLGVANTSVPEGATTATLKLYGKDYQAWQGDLPGSGIFYLDNLSISTRAAAGE